MFPACPMIQSQKRPIDGYFRKFNDFLKRHFKSHKPIYDIVISLILGLILFKQVKPGIKTKVLRSVLAMKS